MFVRRRQRNRPIGAPVDAATRVVEGAHDEATELRGGYAAVSNNENQRVLQSKTRGLEFDLEPWKYYYEGAAPTHFYHSSK